VLGPELWPTGRGGMPRVTGQQPSWALAWWPGPTDEVARGAGTGCARRARSPRARGGALTDDSVVASRRQGPAREHQGAPPRAPVEGGDGRLTEEMAQRVGAEQRRCSRVVEALRRSAGIGSSSCSTIHRGYVRSGGRFGRRTQGGGAHHEAAVAAMAAQQAARSGHGVGAGADERSKVRGGMPHGALRGKNGGGDETGRGGIRRCPF
jgi:hypothetical protein